MFCISDNAVKFGLMGSSVSYFIISQILNKSSIIICNGVYVLSYSGGNIMKLFVGDTIANCVMINNDLIGALLKHKLKTSEIVISTIGSVSVGAVCVVLYTGIEYGVKQIKHLLDFDNLIDFDDYVVL